MREKIIKYFTYIILITIVLGGIFLRTYKLNEIGFWVDEIYTVQHAQESLSNILFFTKLKLYPDEYVWRHVHPPLHYLVTKMMLIIDDSDAFLRLPSIIFGVLSIFAIYKLGAMLYSRKAGIISAALLSVNPLHITFSRVVRFQSYLVFFTILTIIFLILAMKEKKISYWIYFSLFSILNFYTNFFAIFVFVSAVFYIMISLKFDENFRSQIKRISISFSIIFVSIIPVILKIYKLSVYNLQGTGGHEIRIPILRLFEKVSRTLMTEYRFCIWIYGVFFLIGLVWFCFNRKKEFLFFLCWIIVPFIFIYIMILKHSFKPRYFIFMLPLFILLISSGIDIFAEFSMKVFRKIRFLKYEMSKNFIIVLIVGFFIFISLKEIWCYISARPYRDYKGIAEFINENVSSESFKILERGSKFSYFERYLNENNRKMVTKNIKQLNNPNLIFITFSKPCYHLIQDYYPRYRVADAFIGGGMDFGVVLLKKIEPAAIEHDVAIKKNGSSFRKIEVRIKEKNKNSEMGQIVPLCILLRESQGENILEKKYNFNYLQPNSKLLVSENVTISKEPENYIVEAYLIKETITFSPFSAAFYSTCGVKEYDSSSFFGMVTTVKKNNIKQQYLVYGPYLDLDKGEYTLAYLLSAKNIEANKSLCLIDVSIAGGDKILASKEIHSSDFKKEDEYQCFFLNFKLDSSQKLEFRVRYDGNSDMSCGGIIGFKYDIDSILEDGNMIFQKKIKS